MTGGPPALHPMALHPMQGGKVLVPPAAMQRRASAEGVGASPPFGFGEALSVSERQTRGNAAARAA